MAPILSCGFTWNQAPAPIRIMMLSELSLSPYASNPAGGLNFAETYAMPRPASPKIETCGFTGTVNRAAGTILRTFDVKSKPNPLSSVRCEKQIEPTQDMLICG